MPHTSRFPLCLLSGLVATFACAPPGDTAIGSESSRSRLHDWVADSAPLQLELVEQTTLVSDSLPFLDVTALEVAHPWLVLLDAAPRRVVVFADAGDTDSLVGATLDLTGEMRRPQAISISHSRLVVADGGATRTIASIDLASGGVEYARLQTGSSTTAVAVSDHFVAAASTMIQDPRGPSAGVATVILDSATTLNVCPPPQDYARSERRRGMISMVRAFGVRARGDTLFCRFPIAPGATLFVLSTAEVLPRAITPSFYRAPVDQPQSMNQQRLNRFADGWAENADFFPLEVGLLGVYTTFDASNGERAWWLHHCVPERPAHTLRCREGRVPSRPLAAPSADSVFLIDYDTPDGRSVTLLRYRIR